MTTTTTTTPKKKKEWPMPKTVRPKEIVIDDKMYYKCPYKGCNHMTEAEGYDPKAKAQWIMRSSSDDIYRHIKQVHGYVWLSKGGRGGWWPLTKFHPKPEE